MISTADISFVFQGPISLEDAPALTKRITELRAIAPDSEIIVSTWKEHAHLSPRRMIDKLVTSDDPGPLRGIRPDGQLENNVNRQIVSSSAGLRVASRPYAAKVRIDTDITGLEFIALFERFSKDGHRILAPSFFTLDPYIFERIPHHISDWFHFGRTEDVRLYWNAPLMTQTDSEYYATHPYAPGTGYLERKFQCRLAVEQHLGASFAKKKGLAFPKYHNDCSSSVLAAHDTLMREHLIIADYTDMGIRISKFGWASHSTFQHFNCVSHLDWLRLVKDQYVLAKSEIARIRRRRHIKLLVTLSYIATERFWFLIDNRAVRAFAKAVVKPIITWIDRSADRSNSSGN